MKRTVNYAILYAILAMIGGIFYREYTKFMGFDGNLTAGQHLPLYIPISFCWEWSCFSS